MGEFELIERFFKRPAQRNALGVGDDCALVQPAAGTQLAVSSDMLVEGRHFLAGADPERLGHKCLAVNLSDLAACGAKPLAFTLAFALPSADEAWLAAFSRGLFALADEHGCELVGGDTTQGPLNICITVFGEVPVGQALLRSGARTGDDIWVSGSLGDARLALEAHRGTISLPDADLALARDRMDKPTPRVALGMALRGIANAAVDVSDGLIGDLTHILRASNVGARIEAETASTLFGLDAHVPRKLEFVLAGGDDYELAFTAAAHRHDDVLRAARSVHTRVTRIGRVEAQPGVRVVDGGGNAVEAAFRSFDHFA